MFVRIHPVNSFVQIKYKFQYLKNYPFYIAINP
jgi:hypothetical protein